MNRLIPCRRPVSVNFRIRANDMGVEILYPLAWLMSLVAVIWLVVRIRNAHARPYALPTLAISFVVALLWALGSHKPGYYWHYVFVWFAPTVIVLGLQAHLIRWLVRRGAAVDAHDDSR